MDGERELIELEHRYWKAMCERDAETAVELTDFPCIVTGPHGVGRIDEAQYRSTMQNHKGTITKAELRDIEVRFLSDDVAVVAYNVHEEMNFDGKIVKVDAADSSTWIRRHGAWACAAHAEAIREPPRGAS